jgi:hypothetical protein
MVNAPTIQSLDTVKSRHFIRQARGEQDLARPHSKAVGAGGCELISGRGYLSYTVRAHLYGRVLFEFKPTPGQQVSRGRAFVAKQAMYSPRRLISRLSNVAQNCAATASSQHDGSAKARRAAANNNNVINIRHTHS